MAARKTKKDLSSPVKNEKESTGEEGINLPGDAADNLSQRRRQFAAAIILAIVTSCMADILLKHGLAALSFPAIHTLPDALQSIRIVLGSHWMVAGILLILTDFAAFVRALQLGALSVAVPLRASTYVLTAMLAHILLGEPIPPVRWIGLALVLVGVCLVGRSALDSL